MNSMNIKKKRTIGEKLEDFGFIEASNSGGNPDSLESSLKHVCNKLTKKLTPEQITNIDNKVERISFNISNKQKKIDELNKKEILSLNTEKNRLLEEIESIESGKSKFKHELNYDPITWSIQAFVCVILFFYIVIFYISATYSAFYSNPLEEIQQSGSGFSSEQLSTVLKSIFNPNALKLAKKDTVSFLFVILSPAIFICLGLLVHISLQRKQYKILTSILAGTFIFDSVLSYNICKNLYEFKYLIKLTNTEWNWINAIRTSEFYTIILFGFVAYVVWGVLFYFVMEAINQPSLIEIRKNKIKAIGFKLKEFDKIIYKLNDEIENYNKSILKYKQKKKENLQDLSIEKLEKYISYFMRGWRKYIRSRNKNVEHYINLSNKIEKKFLIDYKNNIKFFEYDQN